MTPLQTTNYYAVKYKNMYVSPKLPNFKLFKSLKWKTRDALMAKGLVDTYNKLHKNDCFVLVKITPVSKECYWESQI